MIDKLLEVIDEKYKLQEQDAGDMATLKANGMTILSLLPAFPKRARRRNVPDSMIWHCNTSERICQ